MGNLSSLAYQLEENQKVNLRNLVKYQLKENQWVEYQIEENQWIRREAMSEKTIRSQQKIWPYVGREINSQ